MGSSSRNKSEWFMISMIMIALACGCSQFRLSDERLDVHLLVSRKNEAINVNVPEPIQVAKLLKLSSGEFKMPIVIRPIQRFGAFDRVYYPLQAEDAVRALDHVQKVLYMPMPKDVIEYVLLVRRLGGEWRCHVISSDELRENTPLSIPPLTVLPLVSDLPDGERILELLRIGRREIARMQDAEP